MKKKSVSEYISSLLSSKDLGAQVVYHQVLPEKPPDWQDAAEPWPAQILEMFESSGLKRLYQHQARTIDRIRTGRHVVVATPTASGKTLAYNLPVLERIAADRQAKALYIFPLKALAQDQLRTFNELAGRLEGDRPTAAIYDGDTSAYRRKRIRDSLPHVILTNPEMLHLSFLPYHEKWALFFSKLKTIVVDEVHTYRGIMGSHMAQVFKRLLRVCRFYHARPTFVFCSATIANPSQLASQLTGLKVDTVSQSGAPQGKKRVVFINPYENPAQTAIKLLRAALHRELRTIVYTQSRKLAELIAVWAKERSGAYAGRISAYRAGFLPEERREIEAKLADGSLLAVVSTSALELGIDIGDLDLCILVGYPGSIISTWQRSGRVGRSGQESALVLVAGEDALDQYFMRNPNDFFNRPPEAAVINPQNPEILSRHLTCAAAEMPLRIDEPMMTDDIVRSVATRLENEGLLLKSADGREYFSSRKAPHRQVDLRGTGTSFRIESSRTGESRGDIDGFRAFKETHTGAIYLHQGETYRVDALDLETGTVKVSRATVDYYTRVRGHKETEILETYERKTVWGTKFFCGRLKVTDQVSGYEKWLIRGRKKLSVVPLELPPLIFETEGIWFSIPIEIQRECEERQHHFMGGIHAIEHAAIGIFPLLVMADRNDLGGISIPHHPQTRSAAIFIYDGVPGGAGLSRLAFERAGDLFNHTLKAIQTCPCESGCPSCVHSPKCGSGNRPIEKSAAVYLLERFKSHSVSDSGTAPVVPARIEKPKNIKVPKKNTHYGVFDIETQRSAQEVGGWHRADLMRVSCAVVYDAGEDRYIEFLENQVQELIEHLAGLELVIGFNIKRFDYQVLSGYSDFDFRKLPTLDILEKVHARLGYRLSLDHLAKVTLKTKKSADGLQALRWWKQGRIREIVEYCTHDVEITRDLYLYGQQNGYLLFTNKAGHTVRVPVEW